MMCSMKCHGKKVKCIRWMDWVRKGFHIVGQQLRGKNENWKSAKCKELVRRRWRKNTGVCAVCVGRTDRRQWQPSARLLVWLHRDYLLHCLMTSRLRRLVPDVLPQPRGFVCELAVSCSVPSFSALTLLVGQQEGHLACKITSVLGYLRDYLSAARYRIECGPADATAICYYVLP